MDTNERENSQRLLFSSASLARGWTDETNNGRTNDVGLALFLLLMQPPNQRRGISLLHKREEPPPGHVVGKGDGCEIKYGTRRIPYMYFRVLFSIAALPICREATFLLFEMLVPSSLPLQF